MIYFHVYLTHWGWKEIRSSSAWKAWAEPKFGQVIYWLNYWLIWFKRNVLSISLMLNTFKEKTVQKFLWLDSPHMFFYRINHLFCIVFSSIWGNPLYQPNRMINLSYFNVFTVFNLRRYYRRSLAGWAWARSKSKPSCYAGLQLVFHDVLFACSSH